MMKVVNKGLEVRLYPDEDMVGVLNQNIGNARFTWNHLLDEYMETYSFFVKHGYNKLKCNMTTFNTLLNMLKTEHDFLYLSESSSLQQVYRNLINAFKKFFNEGAGFPRFKSKKNHKQSFRIQNNKNIKLQDNMIVLPKIGKIYFRTSREYKQILMDENTKINHVTIKIHNGKYYAAFNIETPIKILNKNFDSMGIDLGLRTLATLSNGLKITNLDLTHEEKMITKCQRQLSRKKHNSPKLQRTALKSLVDKIKYKCEWYEKEFIQVSRWFASSKLCSHCGHYNKSLKDETEWKCPKCGTHHDRYVNAAKNILNEGLRIIRHEMLNLWDRG